jgi:hypothetical protein
MDGPPQKNIQPKIDVYFSWFCLNFLTGLIPLGLTIALHNQNIPSSIKRDVTSGYLAYMATLVLVSLHYDTESKGLYRTRRVVGNLFVGVIALLYVFYNSNPVMHQLVNTYAVPTFVTIYLASVALAFFLNRASLNNAIAEQVAKEAIEAQTAKRAIDEAKARGVAVKGMAEELSREDGR